MAARSIRTLIRVAAVAALASAPLGAAQADDAKCVASVLAALGLSNPLAEEAGAVIVCGEVAPVAIQKQAARADQGGGSEPVTTKAAEIK